MSTIALSNTKKAEYPFAYKIFCMFAVLAHFLYHGIRKCLKGKVRGIFQWMLSAFAVVCLGLIFILPSALEQNIISLGQACFFAALLLLGFRCFSGMAGAFRPYRYIRKKQTFTDRKRVLRVSGSAMRGSKKTA